MNILDIINNFSTQEDCLKYLEYKRWGKTPICPYCKSDKNYPVPTEIRHKCNKCNKSFSATVGTIFHNSHIPLQKWFIIISLMLNAKKGISAYQIARDLKMRRPTVWSIMHRIRKAMEKDGELLKGIVEIDETYIGGKPRAKEVKKRNRDDDDNIGGGSGGIKTKSCVFGMVERNGKVKAMKVDNAKRDTLLEKIYNNVERGSNIMSDEYKAYHYLYVDFKHETVCHSALEFVKGACHNNTIEGFWSLLKRGIKGQFHHISKKYLDKYVDEFCWRYNNRDEGAFDRLVGNMLLG